MVDSAAFAKALRPETALAATIWANNARSAPCSPWELAQICAQRGVRCTPTRSRPREG